MGTMPRPTVSGPRRPTSIALSESLLAEAQKCGIDISQAAEEGLAQAVAAKRRELWIEENRAALDSSNDYVERHGLPLARHRMF